ncbi:MAG: type VI secretion system baseplate subunit TssF [Deferrisomatales bacterium]|nr:type VI secretion system baseplate subunit TssF [Deferrisomatales bacterium]
MDPRLLQAYNQELQYLREMGGEFAKEFPKIAGRLGLEGLECSDPYVERLLEGFAFLTARVQLKLDDEFPRFTRHLLEMVYPHYLAPTPSMALVQLHPDLGEGALGAGFVVPRETVLRTPLGKGDRTPCEYRTAHDVTLWPLELEEAGYFTGDGGLGGLPGASGTKAGIRLRLRATAGLTFDKLALDTLPLYLGGGGELPAQLYERLLANGLGVVAQPPGKAVAWRQVQGRSCIRRFGFDDAQALLPFGPRSFAGYRLLQEYFAFPQRFLFVELAGLGGAVRQTRGDRLDVTVLLNRSDPFLEAAVDASNFSLFCTPAINLFPRRADRIHLNTRDHEFHVLPDRTRPMDFEVYDVSGVTGFGTSAEEKQEFLPFYATTDRTGHERHHAFYTVQRSPRALSARQGRYGSRSSYVGSEVYVSLVDAEEAPYATELRQLEVRTRCTNRDLPLYLSVGQGVTDFTLQASAPVAAVRCVAGPTAPQPSRAQGETAWRLISHLSLNYLSLADTDDGQGPTALRELLMLYGGTTEASRRKQVEGLRSIRSLPIRRRMPNPGPVTFGRGLELTLTLDEGAFGGSGAFLLGAVLERFLARYVSINSFTETVVRTVDRGEIIRWPARVGDRQLL